MSAFLERLDAERAKLLSERKRIDGLLDGLEIARRFYLASLDEDSTGSALPSTARMADGRGRASPVRDAVLAALEFHPSGLSSPEAADAAAKILGKLVNKKTASSVLSVAAKDGSVIVVDGRYKLPARGGSSPSLELRAGEKSEAGDASDASISADEEQIDAAA